MNDAPPPSGKFIDHGAGITTWGCYWCDQLFLSRFPDARLSDREVWKCRGCGRFQAIGKAVKVEAGSATRLPANLDPKKLAKIQAEYDALAKLNPRKKPSQLKVSQLAQLARPTVREYWPYLKTC